MIDFSEAGEIYAMMKELATDPRQYGVVAKYRGIRWPEKADEPVISIDWVVNGGREGRFRNALRSPDYPERAPSKDEMLLASLHFACLVVNKHKSGDGVYVSELDDSIRAVNRLMPFWIKKGGNPNDAMMGYDLMPDAEKEISRLLMTDGRAAKEIAKRLATNVFKWNQMPEWGRRLTYSLLTKTLEPPPAPKREPTERQRDTLLVALADGLRDRTFFRGSANPAKFARGEPTPFCGCTIAAAALGAFGITVNSKNASKIYSKKNKLPLHQLDSDFFFAVPRLSGGTILDGEQLDVSANVMKALTYFA